MSERITHSKRTHTSATPEDITPNRVNYEFAKRQLDREWMPSQPMGIILAHQAVIAAYEGKMPINPPRIVRPERRPQIARTLLQEVPLAPEIMVEDREPGAESGELSEFPADDSETMQFRIPVAQIDDSESITFGDDEPIRELMLDQESTHSEQSEEGEERSAETESLLDRFLRLESRRQRELQKLMDRLGIMIGELYSGRVTKDTPQRLASLVLLTQELRELELQRQGTVSDIRLNSGSSKPTPQIGDALLDRSPRYDDKTVDERLMATKAAIQEAQQSVGYGNAKGAIMELESARAMIDSMIEHDEPGLTKLGQLMKELFGEPTEQP